MQPYGLLSFKVGLRDALELYFGTSNDLHEACKPLILHLLPATHVLLLHAPTAADRKPHQVQGPPKAALVLPAVSEAVSRRERLQVPPDE